MPAPNYYGRLQARAQDFSAGRTGPALDPNDIRRIVAHDVSGNPLTRRLPNPGNIPQYHYTFDDRGIYRERPETVQAPHVAGLNPSSLGIARIGFEGDALTPAAQANAELLARGLSQRYGVPVVTHPSLGSAGTRAAGGKDPREASWLPPVLATTPRPAPSGLMALGTAGATPPPLPSPPSPAAATPAPMPTPTPSISTPAPVQTVQAQTVSPDIIRQMLQNPYARETGQRLLLEQYKRSQPPTPQEQLQQQKLQLEVERLRDPRRYEAAQAAGKAQGEAQGNLPRAIGNAENALRTIEQVAMHRYLPQQTGWTSYLPSISPAAASFNAALAQLKGQAFLAAFQELKGGGHITEIEGQKATEAIARLDTTQSEDDFLRAVDDLETVVRSGLARAYIAAGREPPKDILTPQPPWAERRRQALEATGALPPGNYVFDPTTGQLRRP
ncbi:MAG TPA: N-acetylmuramoyl-L-alanine amidase [Xanthobacteraceae bacterium]|nr:N-acetylmuramoyl-L-alanine amidase [Xanthobacteraceae bacterium]